MERYQPPPIPKECSPELRRFLEDEFALLAYWINHLLQYNEDNP